jgi:hypothetical protein
MSKTKPNRRFVPGEIGTLEDRVVLTASAVTSAQVFALPTLSTKTLNRSLSRIDASFNKAMANYRRAFVAATRVAAVQGEFVALDRLAVVANRIGTQLARELTAAPYGVPYGAVEISPSLTAIGQSVQESLTSVGSLDEARTVGHDTFYPAWTEARATLNSIVRESIFAGEYRWK